MIFLTAVSRNFLRQGPVRLQRLLEAVAFSGSDTTLIEYIDIRAKSDIIIELLVTGSIRYCLTNVLGDQPLEETTSRNIQSPNVPKARKIHHEL